MKQEKQLRLFKGWMCIGFSLLLFGAALELSDETCPSLYTNLTYGDAFARDCYTGERGPHYELFRELLTGLFVIIGGIVCVHGVWEVFVGGPDA